MKYIKIYEDIFDDWDWDEDDNHLQGFEIGDIVLLRTSEYYRSDNYDATRYIKGYESSYRYISSGWNVTQVSVRNDGEPIMKLGNNWPWYEMKWWIKI